MLCCKVIDACTTLNDVRVKSKFVLNVMLEPKVDLHILCHIMYCSNSTTTRSRLTWE